MTAMRSLPEIVSRKEWLTARKQLLAEEKELTRMRDRVNAARRRLPMVRVDKPYTFDTAEQHGIRVSVVLRGLPHPFSVAFLPKPFTPVILVKKVREVLDGPCGLLTATPPANHRTLTVH
jgi:hypothetical protein